MSYAFLPLFIFHKNDPYHDVLHSTLGAHSCYIPDIGYVQGCPSLRQWTFSLWKRQMAFIAIGKLMNKPCLLVFFSVHHSKMLKYFRTFEVFFEDSLFKLFLHIKSCGLAPDIYLSDWIFTQYHKPLLYMTQPVQSGMYFAEMGRNFYLEMG